MQDQKLASPVVASLQGEEQPAAAVLRLSHQVQAGSVFQADKVHWHGRLSLSPRLEDKLTLATEEGTKLVSALYSSLAFYKDRYKDEHGKMRRLFT